MIALTLLSGVIGLLSPPATVGSQPVYGAYSTPLVFDHARHAALGLSCDTCHGGAASSARPGDRLLPAESSCFECHAPNTADPAAGCATCHPGYRPDSLPAPRETARARPYPPPVVTPTASLHFSHRLHLEKGAQCADCHAGVERSTTAEPTHLPDMATCVACHVRTGAPNQCSTCHPVGPDGRLRTALAGGPLVPRGRHHPADHRGDFARQHAAAATADPTYCAECHTPATCDACHTGNARPLGIHPFDYVRIHGIEAARDSASCASCHRAQTFCVDCHVKSGVSLVSGPTTFGRADGTARFHPPGFAGEAGAVPGPDHHQYAARRNLATCVSCHQESDCVVCHAADAPAGLRAGSPHPPGFDCGRALDAAPRGCLKCHRDVTALERACR